MTAALAHAPHASLVEPEDRFLVALRHAPHASPEVCERMLALDAEAIGDPSAGMTPAQLTATIEAERARREASRIQRGLP